MINFNFEIWFLILFVIGVIGFTIWVTNYNVKCPKCKNKQPTSNNKKERCNKCSTEWFDEYEEENN